MTPSIAITTSPIKSVDRIVRNKMIRKPRQIIIHISQKIEYTHAGNKRDGFSCSENNNYQNLNGRLFAKFANEP